jgi:thiamine kinase-like enzyme
MEREALEALAAKVPAWRGRTLALTRLAGGITNESFRVDAGGERFVLRRFAPDAEHLGIDREREHACAAIAAGLGVGPEVVAFLPEERALVSRFIDAAPVPPEKAREPATLERVIRALRRVHEGPPFPGSFSAFDTVRAYHRLALARGVPFPETVPRAFALMERIEEAVATGRRIVPCHNDLLAANFLDDGARIWILDWEYAAMGDPFFDLGNFAVNQELDSAGARRLLEAYSGAAGREDIARLELMKLASDLRESFWGFLQKGISRLDFDYLAYARKHLERFLAAASAPELERHLEAVG